MIKQETSKYGTVDIERPVAAHIVRRAVMRFRANAIMTDSKLRTVTRGRGEASDKSSDFVKIAKGADDRYSVSVNVVVRFGISISRAANEIIAEIRKDLKAFLDFEPAEVIVNVVGVKSKSKPVIKRNIIIKG